MSEPMSAHPRVSTTAATAMYVGAILGPGVLLVPALVADIAGPASVVAWAALLALSAPLALTFAALGVRMPEAGGTAAYAQAAFGPRLGRATGSLFLCGVLAGAPVVADVGGRYVVDVLGGGTALAAAVGGAIVATVVAINARGLSATARVQLVLAGTLALLLALAVATALPTGSADNWTPFAPHGWDAVGSASTVLMFSFIGWEAVSHLVGALADPRRQLPKAIGSAFAIITLLYAALAVATIGVLGPHPSSVPIADLMDAGLGEAGRRATVVLALLLTLGTMTTYVAGALQLSSVLIPRVGRTQGLAVFAALSLGLLAVMGAGALGTDGLTRASSACFVAVYVIATASGVRLLSGGARVAATVSCAVTTVILAFAGVAIVVPVAVAGLALGLAPARRVRAEPARAA